MPDFLLLNHPACISPTSKKKKEEESLSLLLPSAVPMRAQTKRRAQGWSVLIVTEKSTGHGALQGTQQVLKTENVPRLAAGLSSSEVLGRARTLHF